MTCKITIEIIICKLDITRLYTYTSYRDIHKINNIHIILKRICF